MTGRMLDERKNSFIGRDAEVKALVSLLSSGRLTMITGIGGVGKTRLAVRAANVHAARTGDAVYFAGLEAVEHPHRVPLALLRALGLRDRPEDDPLDVIVHGLTGRPAVLVLDNCEHLIDAAAVLVDELLTRLPLLAVLATSRRPLDLDGERVYPLQPLSLTESDSDRSAATTLLLDRVRDSDPHVDTAALDSRAMDELCAALDGLPLSIELVAVWIGNLGIKEISRRLETRFVGRSVGERSAVERQRTLRAIIDWSFELCTPEQQSAWQALSVFSSPFDVDAALAVCSSTVASSDGESSVLATIDALVAQSVVESDREPGRHRLLETIREYGRARAREAGTWQTIQARHFRYFRQRLALSRERFQGPDQVGILAAVRQERLEVQGALSFASSGLASPDEAAQMVSDLRYLWGVGGFLREGRSWCDRALNWETTPRVQVELLSVSAWLALLQGDLNATARRLEQAEDLVDRVPDSGREAMLVEISRWRGSHALFSGNLDGAREHFQASIIRATAGGLITESLHARFQLTIALAFHGDPRATIPAREGLRVTESIGESWMRAHAHWSLSVAELLDGDLASARDHVTEALSIDRDFDDYLGICLMLETWCDITARAGRHRDAAVVLGALSVNWRHIGSDITAFGPHLATAHKRCVTAVRSALGPSRYARAGAEGERFDIHEAVSYALSPPSPTGLLSPREREVASLVREGLSNRLISRELDLSIRTVETHVRHIFDKLGVDSRSRVAAWVERESRTKDT